MAPEHFAFLDFDDALHGVDDASKFDQQTLTSRVGNTAAKLRHDVFKTSSL